MTVLKNGIRLTITKELIRIFLPDGTFKTVQVSVKTTAKEICTQVLSKLLINETIYEADSKEGASIYEVRDGKETKLDDDTKIKSVVKKGKTGKDKLEFRLGNVNLQARWKPDTEDVITTTSSPSKSPSSPSSSSNSEPKEFSVTWSSRSNTNTSTSPTASSTPKTATPVKVNTTAAIASLDALLQDLGPVSQTRRDDLATSKAVNQLEDLLKSL